MTAAVRQGASLDVESGSNRSERLRLFLEPAIVLALISGVLLWAFTRELDDIEARNINVPVLASLTWEHIQITAMVVVIVLLVAVPLGVMVTRPWAKFIAPVVLVIANIGQAAPALGVLVLFFLWTEQTGFWVVVFPTALYALLPVLRNTMIGIQQVDSSLLEAGRGVGMSPFTVLRRIELPLAIPFVLAGLRTSLVLAVGVATLAFFVGGGGLGELIDSGYKLGRPSMLVVGAALAMALALLVDWLGGLAERLLGPKGLR
ncbi:ABC transporter permease [Actinoalloteichus hymeniacidonis]|uniref:ABC-type proline/glycine betaine transport system, permease component n=1 Tax=Actinoalloteichus hymeniacidonis TaxID=340345 RepID=A0AAC9MWJ1_9PSEU|nr:ABC transporter permease [Actinoalloteichus hymeniacidonis]AOS60902.1 ABC-type proline/glycine betaine transport system, permease component [Actinoalloteichus hymeniacidonis]MBB5911098.1 osmoprotectant transport system permease protein [Actinoalloteichus hymeniacidonis]